MWHSEVSKETKRIEINESTAYFPFSVLISNLPVFRRPSGEAKGNLQACSPARAGGLCFDGPFKGHMNCATGKRPFSLTRDMLGTGHLRAFEVFR